MISRPALLFSGRFCQAWVKAWQWAVISGGCFRRTSDFYWLPLVRPLVWEIFAVFAVLGYLAMAKGLPVDQVIKAGPTLAFVVFPEAISRLPFLRELFGVLFFSALVIAGLSSGVSIIEAFTSAVTDKFKISRKGFCVNILISRPGAG